MISHRARLAALLLPLTLVATACGEQKTESPSAPPPSTAVATQSAELQGVKIEGAGTATPKIVPPATPFTVSSAGFRVVEPGKGDQITAEHSVDAHLLVLNGKDGKTIQSLQGPKVATLQMSDESLQPMIRTALVGQQVGSKVLVAIPGKEVFGDQGNPQVGVAAGDTVLFFFDVTAAKKPLTEATGTPVAPKPGLPTVTMGKTPSDPATITVPKSAPPKETVSQVLIQGNGPVVQKGQTVRVSYTGVTWANPSKPFDYSGKSPQKYAEFPIGTGNLIKAWDKSLVGQKVGSRLLVIAPPADGYGAAGQPDAGIKGTDTLVFVLDILDARNGG